MAIRPARVCSRRTTHLGGAQDAEIGCDPDLTMSLPVNAADVRTLRHTMPFQRGSISIQLQPGMLRLGTVSFQDRVLSTRTLQWPLAY